MSSQWVSAYVAHSLALACPQSLALKPVLAYLLRTELPGGGWGFNRDIPPDGDSTANVVYFMALYARQLGEGTTSNPDRLVRSVRTLSAYQSNSDGGFMTYLPRATAKDGHTLDYLYEGSGWCISHTSVTGLACVALSMVDDPVFQPCLQHGTDYLRSTQDPAGYWEDHWWHDRIYATYWAARFLASTGDRVRLSQATHWLVDVVQDDGSWGNGKGGSGAAFYTALAMSTLLLEKNQKHLAARVRRGLGWLLEAQRVDGSWESCQMLLTPIPEILVPWQSDHPSAKQANADQNRLFTTATVLAALTRCREWLAWS